MRITISATGQDDVHVRDCANEFAGERDEEWVILSVIPASFTNSYQCDIAVVVADENGGEIDLVSRLCSYGCYIIAITKGNMKGLIHAGVDFCIEVRPNESWQVALMSALRFFGTLNEMDRE